MRSLAVCLLLLVLTANAGWCRTVALVTDVKGELLKNGQAVFILERLEEGDTISLADGVQATLAFTQNGKQVALSGPCELRIDGGGVSLLKGAESCLIVRGPGKNQAAPVPEGVNLAKGAFASRQMFAWRNDPAGLDTTPLLRWENKQKFDEIVVIIEDENFRDVLESTLPGTATSFQVPDKDALEPGTYSVRLIGMVEYRPQKPGLHQLEVLGGAAAEQVRRAEGYYGERLEAEPRDVSAMTGLLAVYAEHMMFTPALDLADKALKLRPQDANLARIRDRLRQVCQGE